MLYTHSFFAIFDVKNYSQYDNYSNTKSSLFFIYTRLVRPRSKQDNNIKMDHTTKIFENNTRYFYSQLTKAFEILLSLSKEQ